MGTVQPIAALEGQMPHLKDPKCINQLEMKEEELPRVLSEGYPEVAFPVGLPEEAATWA